MSIAVCRLRLSFSRSCHASQMRGRVMGYRMLYPRSRYRYSYSKTLQETRARRGKGNNTEVPVEPTTQKIDVIKPEESEEEDVEMNERLVTGSEEEEQEYEETVIDKPPLFPMRPSKTLDVASMTTPALPPWVWVLIGIVLANVLNKIMNFVTRPKEAMAELMMKQMANAMKQQGMGTASSPFGNMPPGFAGSGPPPVDTYASTVMPTPTPPPPPTPPPSPTQTTQTTQATQKTKKATGTNATVGTETPKVENATNGNASFFKDVGVGNGNTSTNQQGEKSGDSDAAVDFMFEMLKDPTMRESLYQFLPESMRNPETLETVMQSPMVREQFKTMMTPEMIQQMKSFQGSMSDPNMKQQLDNMNVSPDVLMKKLMNEPELWSMLQKPNVMQAVMDLQQNPNNMAKYMNDPEVMQVMMKMNELTFQAQSEMAAAASSDEGQQQQPNSTIDVSPSSPPSVENTSAN